MKEKFLYVSKPSIGGGGYLIHIEREGWMNLVMNEFDGMINGGDLTIGEDVLFRIEEHDGEKIDNANEFMGW